MANTARNSFYPFRSEKAKEVYTEYYHKTEKETWPVPYEDHLIPTIFGPTHVRVSGPEGAPPVVLLHGITAASLMWYPNVESLAQNHRVYAVDTINDYGLSVNTQSIWRKSQLVLWLDNLLYKLVQSEKVTLIGMSYGGWLASQYALRYQEKLAKLVLIAPGATVLPLSWKFIASLAALFFLPGALVQPILLRWVSHSVDEEDIPSDALSNFIICFLRGYSKFKQRFVVPLSVLSPEQWQSLQLPILFMVGSEEQLYSATEAVEHLQEVAPQVKSVVIPACGHDLTFVRAEEVNQELQSFLNSHKA